MLKTLSRTVASAASDCYSSSHEPFKTPTLGGRGGRSGGGSSVLRALDKTNGKIVAEVTLPAAPSGTPMTYMAGGKQFVVLATMDRKLVAISLPD